MRRQNPRQLIAGVDAELLVHVTQVVFDGLRAQEQGGRGFAGRSPPSEQDSDLQLLWGQLHERARVPGMALLAGRGELGVGALGPRASAEALERFGGCPQLFARQDPVPGPPQALAIGQPGPRRLETVGGQRVLGQCLLEGPGEAAAGEQSLAPERAGQ